MTTLTRSRQAENGAFIVDRSGTILGFDQALEGLTGWPATEMVGRNKQLGRTLSPGINSERPLGNVSLYDGDLPEVTTSRSLELTLHCRNGRAIQVEAFIEAQIKNVGE